MKYYDENGDFNDSAFADDDDQNEYEKLIRPEELRCQECGLIIKGYFGDEQHTIIDTLDGQRIVFCQIAFRRQSLI